MATVTTHEARHAEQPVAAAPPALVALRPGWRRSIDVAVTRRADRLCDEHHAGQVLAGRIRLISVDGVETVVGPGERYEMSLRHDWIVEGTDTAVVRAVSSLSPACVTGAIA